ncbi:MAG TPA: radical SAM family heme chaperone HemW [Microlunatus sp.]|nr:radical SAM family heme chaperone HemW [Microlunatus sp.]
MPSILPAGDPVPADGALPAASLAEVGTRPLGIYLHVPFCRTRCGYCDFNTYTPAELRIGPIAADPQRAATGLGDTGDAYLEAAAAEIELAGRVLGAAAPRVSTVFVGGGTPTLLPAADLVRLLDRVRDVFGLSPDAEVTTEANPESVNPGSLAELRAGGFTRISFGMQSAVAHVLATLDRVHTPGRPVAAVTEARVAGFDQVSLDLIYGTPGESMADWRHSLEVATGAEPDHVSAYALVVEEGTKLAARVRRGELPLPDDDDLADKYLTAEEVLTSAGFSAYEVSNWAARDDAACRHNLGYWRGDHWWGIGPGAHSHVGGTRWWNVKHPVAYAGRLAAGHSPAQARELLTEDDRRLEQVLLEIRLAEGMPLDRLSDRGREQIADLTARGLVVGDGDRLRLTLTGRLLADGIVRELVD